MARSFVLLLLTAVCCRGQAETGVSERLKAEFKEVFPYAPPRGEKLALSGEPEQKGGPSSYARSPAYKADAVTVARRAAVAKQAMQLPPSWGDSPRRADPDPWPSGVAGEGAVAKADMEGAGSTSKDSRPKPAQKEAGATADSEVLILPKVEVTAKRRTKLEAQVDDIESQQRSEEKATKTTWLDAVLNPPFFSLGGAAGNARAETARRRIEVLRWVKLLTISLEEAKSPEEKARIQANIDTLKEITRHWR